MNFTAIFCCYVLLPYIASIVSPPEEAITCYAVKECDDESSLWFKIKSSVCPNKRTKSNDEESSEEPPVEPMDQRLYVPEMDLDDKYFVQDFDHYQFKDIKDTWKQRYLIYDHHYGGNGVIFIQIGTDDDITPWKMQNGLWFKYCRNAKALCVGLVRRSYDERQFSGNLSNNRLKYMNSDQALADVAWFIYNFRDLHTKYELPKKLMWVAYGKGKQGTLAAWLRMKYPHLVHAALSLCAPLLAEEEFDNYFKHIEQGMLNIEDTFKGEISKAFKEIKKKINKKKFEELGELFNFCDKNSLGDAENGEINTEFMYFLFAHTVARIMHYGNDDMKLMKKRATDLMLATTVKYKNYGSAMNRFAHLIRQMLKKYNKRCLQTNYVVAMNGYKERTDSGYEKLDYLLPQIFGNLTSLYQSCSEFGRFETFNKFFKISIYLTYYNDICQYVFGKEIGPKFLERGVNRTNLFYGGLDIIVSHVIFVFGSNDPYRGLGMSRHLPRNSVYSLEGARHCSELDSVNGDPAALNKLKEVIFHQLLDWLQLNVYSENSEGNNIID